MPREVMTVEEVAEYLGLSKPTIYKLARRGEIPAAKVGRSWRFHRHAVEQMMLPRESPETYRERLRERMATEPTPEQLEERRRWYERSERLRKRIAREFPHQTDSAQLIREERERRYRQLAGEEDV